MNTPLHRRDFLKQVCFTSLALPLFQACTPKKDETAKPAASPSPTAAGNLVSEDFPTAKALKYVSEASRGDPQFKVAKAGVAPQDQFCNNCMFYKAVEAGQYGSCQLITPGHVTDKGWCMSWAVKTA